MQAFDIIVIGSGPAGRRAAVQAAKLKKSVLVVEKGRRVGGVVRAHGDDTVEDAARDGAEPVRLAGARGLRTGAPEQAEDHGGGFAPASRDHAGS